ncbi:MAG: dicarboxylate/amino acid:cation symporter [Rickettsiaceae bacterium H1]|nr:dicarboxylate/amino acid:cation symporter [Rickettsiaceae bacterium H1]
MASVATYYLQSNWLFSVAEVVSEVFIGLLKLISLPVVFFSILSTLSGLDNLIELKNLAKKIIYYTLFTTIIAAIISLILYLLINPASHLAAETVKDNNIFSEGSNFSHYILNLVPTNFVQVFLDNNIIGVMLIAFVMGIASLTMEAEKRKTINNLFSVLFDLILQVTQFILKLLPLAIWAFVVSFLNNLETVQEVNSILLYIICVSLANFLQAFVVLPLLLKIKGISPIETFRGSSPALALAFFSKSSGATLPTTLKCVQCDLGVSEKVSSFSLPICSTINMNACAAFILITVLFVSESHGFNFSIMDLVMWVFLSVGAAIGNAGVPMGCYFMATTYLIAMGVPLNIMGLILPLYSILDMFETMINVWSDICIARIVDKK